MMGEMVSCVMATKDRPAFFRIALECFLRQSYKLSELIVVDDGEPSVEPQCAGLERVRYLRLPQPALLGAKLNIGIAAAQGGIVQKLDDDDYYGPEFLQTAVNYLARQPQSIVAWDCFLVLRAGETILRDSRHGWKAGGTLCFSRTLWEQQPFRDVPKSVDSWFLRDHNVPVTKVCEPTQYLLVRHGNNTWRHMQGGSDADAFLRTLPVSPTALAQLVHPEAEKFYRGLSG